MIEPSLKALINGEYVTFDSLSEKIDALEEVWVRHNAGRSITDYNHFAHYQIIGLGSYAIPFLIAKTKKGSSIWFVALKAISGVNPDSEVKQGDAKAAREAWIKWGENQ